MCSDIACFALMQDPRWKVCVYAGKERLGFTAEDLADYDIVLATPETMFMDSPLKIEKSLHQWVSFLLMHSNAASTFVDIHLWKLRCPCPSESLILLMAFSRVSDTERCCQFKGRV